jgi:hypothetical protein
MLKLKRGASYLNLDEGEVLSTEEHSMLYSKSEMKIKSLSREIAQKQE